MNENLATEADALATNRPRPRVTIELDHAETALLRQQCKSAASQDATVLRITVSPSGHQAPAPEGTVNLKIDGTQIGWFGLQKGGVFFVVTERGTRVATAHYSGDAHWSPVTVSTEVALGRVRGLNPTSPT